jgi:hypothetical protein
MAAPPVAARDAAAASGESGMPWLSLGSGVAARGEGGGRGGWRSGRGGGSKRAKAGPPHGKGLHGEPSLISEGHH